jgi:hypothetical protein
MLTAYMLNSERTEILFCQLRDGSLSFTPKYEDVNNSFVRDFCHRLNGLQLVYSEIDLSDFDLSLVNE